MNLLAHIRKNQWEDVSYFPLSRWNNIDTPWSAFWYGRTVYGWWMDPTTTTKRNIYYLSFSNIQKCPLFRVSLSESSSPSLLCTGPTWGRHTPYNFINTSTKHKREVHHRMHKVGRALRLSQSIVGRRHSSRNRQTKRIRIVVAIGQVAKSERTKTYHTVFFIVSISFVDFVRLMLHACVLRVVVVFSSPSCVVVICDSVPTCAVGFTDRRSQMKRDATTVAKGTQLGTNERHK